MCVFIKHSTTQFQYTHELIYGFAVNDLLFTFTGVQVELTLHGVHDAACEVLVLHGGCFAYLGIIGHSAGGVKRLYQKDRTNLSPSSTLFT